MKCNLLERVAFVADQRPLQKSFKNNMAPHQIPFLSRIFTLWLTWNVTISFPMEPSIIPTGVHSNKPSDDGDQFLLLLLLVDICPIPRRPAVRKFSRNKTIDPTTTYKVKDYAIKSCLSRCWSNKSFLSPCVAHSLSWEWFPLKDHQIEHNQTSSGL